MRARLACLLTLAMVVGCGEKPEAKPNVDTTPTGPVEDIEPPPPQQAEPSRIGQMPLLRGAPPDGRCSTRTMSTGQRYIMEGDYPLRTISVEIGPPTRPFVPVFIDVKGKQVRGDGQEENEWIYVGFTETGEIQSGRRQYFLTGTAPKDVGTVTPDDVQAAKQLALQVMQRCKPA